MSDTSTEGTEAVGETSADTSTEETTATETSSTTEGEGALGDAGKKALDAMKAKWKTEADERKKLAAEFEAFKAKAEGKEAEFTAAQEAQRIKDEALAAANERILKADIRTAAKGKLNDPADAFRYPEDIDLSAFEPNADGEYDAEEIARAIDRLIEKKPYLAAQGSKRFQGTADGGARNGAAATSIDDQIAAATKAGNHLLAINLKQQRAAELAASKS